MAHNLIILPEAEADMRQGYAWYEQRREGLGEEFLEHLALVADTCRDAADKSPKRGK